MAEQDEAPAVLYVDDEHINLRVFEANFRTRFTVLTADSGPDALDILAQRSAQIAVLITDQRMPGMSGVELLERARDAFPDVRRMLITAYSDMRAVMDAVNRGQRVRDIEARMLRSERLAALGQVSAGIAHELMNPVGYMTQNLDALRREIEILRGALRPMLERAPNPEISEAFNDLPGIVQDVETA